jgi:copper(I)-binding protein
MFRSRLAQVRQTRFLVTGLAGLLSACAPELPEGPFQNDHGATAVSPPPGATAHNTATSGTTLPPPGHPPPGAKADPSTSQVDGPPSPVVLRHAWARPTPPGAPAAAVYGELHHPGPGSAHIVGADTPFAEVVELHESAESGGMMTMRPLTEGLQLSEGQTRTLAPGGLHIMLIGLRGPLTSGETLPLRLRMADGSMARVSVPISDAAPPAHADGG